HGQNFGDGHAGAGVSVGTNGISVFEHTHGYLPSPLVYNKELSGWFHVVVVYINKQPSLYVNGTLVHTGVKSTTTVHPGVCLGSQQGYGTLTGTVEALHRAQ